MVLAILLPSQSPCELSAVQNLSSCTTPAAVGRTAPLLPRAHRWKVLGVGVAANASFMAAANGLPATAVWMRQAYRLDNAGLGLLLGSMGLGLALSELPWGAAADRWGDRRVLLCGLISTALILLMMALYAAPGPHHVPALLVAMSCAGLAGMAGGSVNGASGRAVMRWFHEGERGLAMSIRQTAVPLGGGLGALILPVVAAHAGFGWVYGVLAVFCAASATLTWLWLHEPPGAVSATGHARPVAAGSPLRSGRVWRIASAIGLLCAPQFAILSFASVFLHDAAHVGLPGISITLCVIQVGAMVARIWSGRLTDRYRNRPAWLRNSALIGAVAFVPLAVCSSSLLASPAWLTMAAVALAGVVISAWHGVAYAELASQAGAERAGTALGLTNTLVFLAYFLTPAVIPFLLGGMGAWLNVWVCAAGVALLVWRLFPAA
jgi:predicted MFS family arabinose efflux permease